MREMRRLCIGASSSRLYHDCIPDKLRRPKCMIRNASQMFWKESAESMCSEGATTAHQQRSYLRPTASRLHTPVNQQAQPSGWQSNGVTSTLCNSNKRALYKPMFASERGRKGIPRTGGECCFDQTIGISAKPSTFGYEVYIGILVSGTS